MVFSLSFSKHCASPRSGICLEKKPASLDGCRCFRALLNAYTRILENLGTPGTWMNRVLSVRWATAILVHGFGFPQWTKSLEICSHHLISLWRTCTMLLQWWSIRSSGLWSMSKKKKCFIFDPDHDGMVRFC